MFDKDVINCVVGLCDPNGASCCGGQTCRRQSESLLGFVVGLDKDCEFQLFLLIIEVDVPISKVMTTSSNLSVLRPKHSSRVSYRLVQHPTLPLLYRKAETGD
jgi:hypothetical protein